jgi:hypothetical protein
MEYPAKLQEAHPEAGPFPGLDFVRQLNDARVSFKHYGNLPDPRIWYRVIENTWDRVNEWCQKYLGMLLEEINLEELIEDGAIKNHYVQARQKSEDGNLREALEELGAAVYLALNKFPGIQSPILGMTSSEHALLLASYGVRPSDFLSLQRLLPKISKDWSTGILNVHWDVRTTGHRGNWTSHKVDFCLATSLDLILKTQHAPWAPQAVEYGWIFDDVVEPKGESVDIWDYEYEEGRNPFAALYQEPKGRKTVKTLKRGERLRCVVSPERRKGVKEAGPLLQSFATPTLDNAEVLLLMSSDLPGHHGRVEREEITLSSLPKEDDYVRRFYPHLFEKEG